MSTTISLDYLLCDCAKWVAVTKASPVIFVRSSQFSDEPEDGWPLNDEDAYLLEIDEGILRLESREGIIDVARKMFIQAISGEELPVYRKEADEIFEPPLFSYTRWFGDYWGEIPIEVESETQLKDAGYYAMAEFFDDGGTDILYDPSQKKRFPVSVVVEYACAYWTITFTGEKTSTRHGYIVRRLET